MRLKNAWSLCGLLLCLVTFGVSLASVGGSSAFYLSHGGQNVSVYKGFVLYNIGIADALPVELPSDEAEHMVDVRRVVERIGMLALLSLLGVVLLWKGLDEWGRKLSLIVAGVLGLATSVFLLLAAYMSFNVFFTVFHELFFSAGSWQFGPDSVLLALYPQQYWIAFFLGILGRWVVLSILMLLIGSTGRDP
ncbi:hypothetical protein COY28_00040 [Candidatus Woesearchaeota archaeon CG_4_10_14_0_2_um_filter_57_5]|nr:MAG: hypothetical protein AUJ68_05040 [Candidatus Woesearchaeota archaeon CG1_02_57_44]PIN70664.1 MAG: hypothetical protein COV94_01395 [Candidatus Woesearchaeota archaeon CG11_big_fil_rev_8_21_14_0_20_57_5]PIZ57604.1 MAG: hypothetical protein COY28_00040 [Candidatus Woesearchaeota archaeon CG_4_10_14_0_2_um_filter_57_5]